jgi:hypothetical protein
MTRGILCRGVVPGSDHRFTKLPIRTSGGRISAARDQIWSEVPEIIKKYSMVGLDNTLKSKRGLYYK